MEVATDVTPERARAIDAEGKVTAIDRAQAVIEFAVDGTILTANENFLKTIGYGLDEIRGRHHRMFVPLNEAESPAYAEFWAGLAEGRYDAGEYKRIAKGGKELWLLATYNPIFDETGKPFKVVKFANDVTQQKMNSVDYGGQIAAIEKSQAVIEFRMDGTIIRANQNFLDAVGYSLDEIVGRHHGMFVDPAERSTGAYTEFWADLNRGNYRSDEFRRIGKGGRELWIQASYNPILDLNGKPFKVVKYATDTTALAIGRRKASRAHSLIESVAAGSEEMSASIQEISATMSKSRRTAAEAADLVRVADLQASRLNDAAQAMGGIVELIGNITSQINLLALNATIESARAGESGRGFAVVASEVKNLANQAKQATDKITDEIAGLNGVSGDVVSALAGIKRAIEDVREYVNSTAAAVEEQSAVTADMSVNMQRAAAELS
jgi:methyl-accepting chemotaxis protein